MIKVVNCNFEKYDVYIGRPSIWSNPFIIGIDGSRKEVIKKYKIWVKESEDEIPRTIRNNLHILDGKILGCFCKPFECHGDVLIELFYEMKLNNILNWK
jgi:hypothetical protein